MKNKKISFITTVFNEEKTITTFLDSLFSQANKPHEIIIVDGGSTDKTVDRIRTYDSGSRRKKVEVKLVIKRGNRAVGRNEAIKHATGDIIVCSDAGNILDKEWIKNITEPFNTSGVDVVAGYYTAKTKNIFQQCLVPFTLVMEDKIDEKNFLPATRSMAFTKKIWKKVGGFREKFSHNEDYVFANELKKVGAHIVFAKNARVSWIPRDSFKDAYIMFFRFAFGDAEAKILRPKVLFLFARYFFALYFFFLCLLYKSLGGVMVLLFASILYIIWSIWKNYYYVKDRQAVFILPALQLTADAAILSGTTLGLLQVIKNFKYLAYLKNNKFLVVVLSIYAAILLFTIQWGIPSSQHPFPYHMDEWHQLQAVGNTFRYGTPNTAGSANGTMFHFLLSGFYLIPFTLVKFVDPFSLQIDNPVMRERIFEVLRLQTIVFGMLSIIALYKISEMIGASKKLAIFLFTFTPLWFVLSGYFKYDIALMFWMLLSVFFFLRFAKEPTNKNFILSSLPVGLAIATKVSAIPLLLLYAVSYFWFSTAWKKQFTSFVCGILLSIFIVLFFGMPDTVFGKGNILVYLFENIVATPNTTANYKLDSPILYYLFSTHFSVMFGDGLIFAFSLSLLIGVYAFFRHPLKDSIKKYKVELFLFISLFVFIVSLIKLQIGSLGNRSLVLLPFFVLLISFVFKQIVVARRMKIFFIIFVTFIALTQLYATFAFMYIKTIPSPQQRSSQWLEQHIAKNQIIGIENIPIYQYLPHIIQKEFYEKEYKKGKENNYKYKIIDSKSTKLPSVIVITNDDIEQRVFKQSPKNELVNRLRKEGYKRIVTFAPDLRYLSLFATDKDFYLSGIVTAPVNTSIYKK